MRCGRRHLVASTDYDFYKIKRNTWTQKCTYNDEVGHVEYNHGGAWPPLLPAYYKVHCSERVLGNQTMPSVGPFLSVFLISLIYNNVLLYNYH